MENLSYDKVLDVCKLFGERFPDAPLLYLHSFGTLPSIHFFPSVEGEKAFYAFCKKFGPLIRHTFQYHTDSSGKSAALNKAVILLDNNCIAEFGEGYARLLYDEGKPSFLPDFGALVSLFKTRLRREPLKTRAKLLAASVVRPAPSTEDSNWNFL